MQPPLPAPTASGAFVKTPFPHLLVYALERALTGTFELHMGALSAATITVVQGYPAKVRTNDQVHFLGDVMVELGMITTEQLQASHARMQESPRLQGQILLELGVIDPQRLEFALRAQVERKIGHLFSLSSDTTFAYYDGIDILQRYGGPPTPIDPLPALWRGVKEAPAWEHVDATLRRLGAAGVRISPTAQVERCGFIGPEQQAIDLLRQRPFRVIDLTNTKLLGPSVAQILIYFLMITKQVDLIDTSSMRPAGQMPPGARMPAIAGPPGGPQSGQAFARVQLQPRQVSRVPLVVEEQVAPSGANDERVSSPGMKAPVPGPLPFTPTPAEPIQPMPVADAASPSADASVLPIGPMDIGAMITQTIASSLPPAAIAAAAPASIPAPAIPPPPGSSPSGATGSASSGSIPAATGSSPRLTAEQNALKMKIIERAEQITGQNYFQMLGLEQDAPHEQVQKSFFNLAKVWHPDRLPGALADVKDACSKVFSHLTEAHATLSDPKKRQEYMTLLKEGGATPDDQAKIQTILEAATEFQKAEILLKRNPNDAQAYDLVKRAVALDPEQVDYMALLTWLDAQLPQWQSREKTLEKIALLDKCVQKNPNCERAIFFRGMLYKRIDEAKKALADFKKASEMNPRNLDAVREVRLHNMRGGTKAPPGVAGTPSTRPKPNQPDTLGGLFGKLFKK